MSNVREVPFSRLLGNFVKESVEEFEALTEDYGILEKERNDKTKRERLLKFFEMRRQQLIRLLVLIKWKAKTTSQLKSLSDICAVMNEAEKTFHDTVFGFKHIAHGVNVRLYPMSDINTSVHVLSSGSYHLLPKVIENSVMYKPTIQPALVESTISRLNSKLHVHLLSTTIPSGFTVIKVKNGLAYLTVEGEFEIGMSLRMAPSDAEKDTPVAWMLFELSILLGIKNVDGTEQKGSELIASYQLAYLQDYLNRTIYEKNNPMVILYNKLHSFCVAWEMDVLFSQSNELRRMQEGKLAVQYIRHQKLTIAYWSDAPTIPSINEEEPEMNVKQRRKKSKWHPKISFSIIVDQNTKQINVEHNPPLADRRDSFNDDSIKINPLSINMSALLYKIIRKHANYRATQLYRFIAMDPTRGAFDSIELIRKRTNNHDSDRDCHQGYNHNCNHDGEHSEGNYRITVRICLIAHRVLTIQTDPQSGCFLLRWPVDDQASGTPEARRLLALAQAQINKKCASLIDILVNIRFHAVLGFLAEKIMALRYQAFRKAPVIFSRSHSTSDMLGEPSQHSYRLYVRLSRSPFFFLVINLVNNKRKRQAEKGSRRRRSGTQPRKKKQRIETVSLNNFTMGSTLTCNVDFFLIQGKPVYAVKPTESNFMGGVVLTVESCIAIKWKDVVAELRHQADKTGIPIESDTIHESFDTTALAFSSQLKTDTHVLWDKAILGRILNYCENKIPLMAFSQILESLIENVNLDIDYSTNTIRFCIPTSLRTTATDPGDLLILITVETWLGQVNSIDNSNMQVEWTASLTHPAIARIWSHNSSSMVSFETTCSRIRLGRPDTLIFSYAHFHPGSAPCLLRDAQCLLTITDFALQLDSYNNSQNINFNNSPPGSLVPCGFFQISKLTSNELHIQFQPQWSGPQYTSNDVTSFSDLYHSNNNNKTNGEIPWIRIAIKCVSTPNKTKFTGHVRSNVTLDFEPVENEKQNVKFVHRKWERFWYWWPQKFFLIANLNHTRKIVPSLLKQVFWSCPGLLELNRFLQCCRRVDMKQETRMWYGSKGSLSVHSVSQPTVEVIPQSATCVRLIFRSSLSSRIDLRFHNANQLLVNQIGQIGRIGNNQNKRAVIQVSRLARTLTKWYLQFGQHELMTKMKEHPYSNQALSILQCKTMDSVCATSGNGQTQGQFSNSQPAQEHVITFNKMALSDTWKKNSIVLESYFNSMVDLPPFFGQPMTAFLNLLITPSNISEHIMQLLEFTMSTNPVIECKSKVSLVDFQHEGSFNEGKGALLMALHFQQNNKASSIATARVGMCFLLGHVSPDTYASRLWITSSPMELSFRLPVHMMQQTDSSGNISDDGIPLVERVKLLAGLPFKQLIAKVTHGH